MKRYLLLAAALAVAALSTPVFSQDAAVKIDLKADMQTFRAPDDGNARDSFTIRISDAEVDTTWGWSCTSGRAILGGLGHADKTCGFQGGSAGKIKNPKLAANDPAAWVPRTQFLGKFSVASDGKTDMSTLSVNYLPNGKPAAFSGSMNLKPGLDSSNFFAGLKDKVMARLELDNSGPIDPRVDTIDWYDVGVPSAGFPSDKGCRWSGHAAFPYQVFSWYMEMTAVCTKVVNKADVEEKFTFQGNMPFLGDNTVEGSTTYNLVLTTGATETDDSLFVDSEDESLFDAVTGITGVITMKNSQIVTVTLDGAPIQNPVAVDASGTLTGTGVSAQVTRSLAMLLMTIPGTFVGP